nr:diguanylate cyclase [Anaerolineae bacterium]
QVILETRVDDLLRQLAEAARGRGRLSVNLVVDECCELPGDIKVAFYRIAQEALNNILKHARAEHVELSLVCDGCSYELVIRDDGAGFVPDEGITGQHLGLKGMLERAAAISAQLEIKSSPGEGATIHLSWTILEGENHG